MWSRDMRFHTVTLLQEHVNLFTAKKKNNNNNNNSDSELTCCGFWELFCSQSFKTAVILISLNSRGTDKESSGA